MPSNKFKFRPDIKTSNESCVFDIVEENSSISKETQIVDKQSIDNHDRIASAELFLALTNSYQAAGRNGDATKNCKTHYAIKHNMLETNSNDNEAKIYQDKGNRCTDQSDYKTAIEFYQKAREISPNITADPKEVLAYQCVGYYNYHRIDQDKESIVYYEQALQLAVRFGFMRRAINSYLGLGAAFIRIGDIESSRTYFQNALTESEQMNDISLTKAAYINLGCVNYKSNLFDAAVESYLKVRDICHDLGERQEEANACLLLGDMFQKLRQYEKAIEYYLETLYLGENLEDKEMLLVAKQRLRRLYLTMAHLSCEDCDYDKAKKYYQYVLRSSRTELMDNTLLEKARNGLEKVRRKIRENEKAKDSIFEVRQDVEKESETGDY